MRGNKNFSYGIIGLGKFGSALAYELAKSNVELLVIDKDEEKVKEFKEITDNAYVADSLDKKTLEESGIQNCDIAIVCIGEHIDITILTALNLVGLGVKKVIAKANSSEHGEILEKIGAEVVYPERDIAIRLANRLEYTKILDFVALSEKINISKFIVPCSFLGKSIKELHVRAKYGLNIIAIESEEELIDIINPDYIFKDGDILYASGSNDTFEKISNLK